MDLRNCNSDTLAEQSVQNLPLDKIIIFLGLFSIGLGAVLFAYNPYLAPPLRSLTSIAKVQSRTLDAKRKITGTLSWIKANQEDPLFNGDQIMTSADASTTVVFESGAKLVIGPMSLVKIKVVNDEFIVELSRGILDFQGIATEKIKIVQATTGKQLRARRGSSVSSRNFLLKPTVKKIPIEKAVAEKPAAPAPVVPPIPIIAPVVPEVPSVIPTEEAITSEKPAVEEASPPVPVVSAEPPPPIEVAKKIPKRKPEPAPLVPASIIPKQIVKFIKVRGFHGYLITLIPYKNAKLYHIDIFSDAELKKLVLSTKTSLPRYQWISNRSGKYFYQVRVEDKLGRMSPVSAPGELLFPISPMDVL